MMYIYVVKIIGKDLKPFLAPLLLVFHSLCLFSILMKLGSYFI